MAPSNHNQSELQKGSLEIFQSVAWGKMVLLPFFLNGLEKHCIIYISSTIFKLIYWSTFTVYVPKNLVETNYSYGIWETAL